MIHKIISDILIPSEDFVFGFSDLTDLIDKKFGTYRYGISIGKKLDNDIINSIEKGPDIVYYNHYFETNKELTFLAEKIRIELLKIDVNAIVIEPTIKIDSNDFDKFYPTLTAEVSHKMLATRAGIGWIGKTDLLISKKFGPCVRLVSLLIDKKPDNISISVDTSNCGKCNKCVDICPAKAANGKLWNIHIYRDEFYNAQKCKEKCNEFGKNLGINKPICGICVSICPIGKKLN